MVRDGAACLGPCSIIAPSRAVTSTVHFQDGARITVASVYLWTSGGTELPNSQIISDVAAAVRAQGDPDAIGGDFQATAR